MNYIIKSASILDIFKLHRLEKICFDSDAWPFIDLVAVLTFRDVVRLKAVSGSQMVGFIAGDVRNKSNLAWIATLAVNPKYRNQGIGTALLKACEVNLDSNQIRLCLRPSNTPALQLYRQSGYETIDHWKEYYNDKGDALVMEKKVTNDNQL